MLVAMSSFLKNLGSSPPRGRSNEQQTYESSSSASKRAAFQHGSIELGSSPLREQRINAFHREIQRRRDENNERLRGGGEFILYSQYQSILASLEREVDKYATQVQDDPAWFESNDYCHGNDSSGILDEVDQFEQTLTQQEAELEYLVEMMADLDHDKPQDPSAAKPGQSTNSDSLNSNQTDSTVNDFGSSVNMDHIYDSDNTEMDLDPS